VKEQLTCTDTVLLISDRLVVTATLQERIVKDKGSSAREGVVPMHGQDGRNKDQGVFTVPSGYPNLHKRTASDVGIT